MSNVLTNTLSYVDTINRVGYTIIDDIKVCQYNCIIPSDKPENMKVIRTKMDEELYRANLELCLADYAAFERAAYEVQAQYMSKTESAK